MKVGVVLTTVLIMATGSANKLQLTQQDFDKCLIQKPVNLDAIPLNMKVDKTVFNKKDSMLNMNAEVADGNTKMPYQGIQVIIDSDTALPRTGRSVHAPVVRTDTNGMFILKVKVKKGQYLVLQADDKGVVPLVYNLDKVVYSR